MAMISIQNGDNYEGRKRKSDVKNNVEEFEDWTHEEKCQLLEALKKYGHFDMKNLRKSVPTKNKEDIKLFTNLLWDAANKSSENYAQKQLSKKGKNVEMENLPVIDKWRQLLRFAQPKKKYNEIKNLPIAKALLYISKLENHPDPEQCNGIDFRALYGMLYNILCGYPIKNMDTPTGKFLLKSFKELEQDIKQQNLKQKIQFLNKLKSVKYVDHYTKTVLPDIQDTGKCVTELSRIQGYNPLVIPVRLLRLNKYRLNRECCTCEYGGQHLLYTLQKPVCKSAHQAVASRSQARRAIQPLYTLHHSQDFFRILKY